MSEPTTPPTLATRLSRTLPHHLVRLAHEPSVGLHFLAAHSHNRSTPALATTHKTLNGRTALLEHASLTARDALDMISVGTSVGPSLSKISQLLAETRDVLEATQKR